MIDVSELKDQQAIDAANFVVREWIKSTGLEAMALWQAIDKVSKNSGTYRGFGWGPEVERPSRCRWIVPSNVAGLLG